MVNPIQITQPQAYSGGADFTPLSKLYDVYKASQQRAMEEQALGQLGDDPIANARLLTKAGTLPLAQLGLGMQDKEIVRRREDIAADQAQRNFQERMKLEQAQSGRAEQQLTIAQAQERDRAAKAAEDTPEGRRAKLIAAKMNPDDPNFAAHIASGAPLPTPIALEVEKRAATTFAEEQKYATREARLAAVKNPEAGLDINDPEIRRWVALGGPIPDMAKNRLGLNPIQIMEPDPDNPGKTRPAIAQLSTTGQLVKPTLPPGTTYAGDIGSKETAKAEAKAATAAKIGLPEVERLLDNTAETINEIVNHPGKSNALGRGSHLPDSWVVGTEIGNFREKVKQLAGEAMQQSMAALKGAGLGSVSDFEQKAMQAAFAAASTAQTEAAFNASMATALRHMDKIRQIARDKAKGDFSVKGGPAAAAPAAAKPDPLGLR